MLGPPTAYRTMGRTAGWAAGHRPADELAYTACRSGFLRSPAFNTRPLTVARSNVHCTAAALGAAYPAGAPDPGNADSEASRCAPRTQCADPCGPTPWNDLANRQRQRLSRSWHSPRKASVHQRIEHAANHCQLRPPTLVVLERETRLTLRHTAAGIEDQKPRHRKLDAILLPLGCGA